MVVVAQFATGAQRVRARGVGLRLERFGGPVIRNLGHAFQVRLDVEFVHES
jgi:hypothetical protein